GMFIVPSNNPSGWAVISAGTTWIALVGFFESEGRRRIGLGILAGVAALIGAGSRGDMAIYTVIAVCAAVVLTVRRDRRYLLLAALPVAITLMAVLFYFTASQGSVAQAGLPPEDSPPTHIPFLVGFNLVQLPVL